MRTDPEYRDDGQRGQHAVVVSVTEVEGGAFRIFIDDVKSADGGNWKKRSFMTCSDLTANEFLNASLSERDLADLGFAVVARLVATNRMEPRKK
jgi:hypothetical protein